MVGRCGTDCLLQACRFWLEWERGSADYCTAPPFTVELLRYLDVGGALCLVDGWPHDGGVADGLAGLGVLEQ